MYVYLEVTPLWSQGKPAQDSSYSVHQEESTEQPLLLLHLLLNN